VIKQFGRIFMDKSYRQHWDFDTRFFVRCYKLEKDVYDEINYNRVLDVIEYDIKNDFIVTRHEIEG
jgi:hypothetical protein